MMKEKRNSNHCLLPKIDSLASNVMLILYLISLSPLSLEGGCMTVPLLESKLQNGFKLLLKIWALLTKLS